MEIMTKTEKSKTISFDKYGEVYHKLDVLNSV